MMGLSTSAQQRHNSKKVSVMVAVLFGLLAWLPHSLADPPPREETLEQQHSPGGADANKSFLQKSASRLSEGVRFVEIAAKVVQDYTEKRPPKTVDLALVGFGRTGTTSIVSALQLLGYTFLHDDTLAEVSDLHAQLWKKSITMDDFVAECGQRGFDAIFFFSDEFLKWAAKSENVKVVLTKRDTARKWAESWLTIASMVDYLESPPFVWSQKVRDLLPGYFQLIYKHISTQGQPEKYKDLSTLESAYEAHLIKVRNLIPEDRLLEFNVKEGWEPLCEFLDKPVPETKFPHVNDRVVVKTLVVACWLITWIWPLAPLLVLYLLWKLIKMILSRLQTTTTAEKKQN